MSVEQALVTSKQNSCYCISTLGNWESTLGIQTPKVTFRGSVGSIPHPKCEMKFFMLPYVEVYVLRSSDDSYLDPNISFFKNIKSKEALFRCLSDYLWFASGDQAQ